MKGRINFPVIIIMDGHIVSYRKNWEKLTQCGINDLEKTYRDSLLIDREGYSYTIKQAKLENAEKQSSFMNKLRNKIVQVDLTFKRKKEEVDFDELKVSLIERLENDDLMIEEDFWEKEVFVKIERAQTFKKLFKAFQKKAK